MLAGDGVDQVGLEALRRALEGEKATVYVIAPLGGTIKGTSGNGERRPLGADHAIRGIRHARRGRRDVGRRPR